MLNVERRIYITYNYNIVLFLIMIQNDSKLKIITLLNRLLMKEFWNIYNTDIKAVLNRTYNIRLQ